VNKANLQTRLDAAKRKYERLMNKTYPSDSTSEHFYLGLVGGSGKPVQKLNRQRARDLDHVIDNAKEMIRLRGVIAHLEYKIKHADDIKIEKPKPTRVPRPRKAKSVASQEYLDWANALIDEMETRIQTARSKMNGIQWDDQHDHYLRGEIAAYIEVQAELISEHFRGNQITVDQLKCKLDAILVKRERELTENPKSRYLSEYCKGLRLGIEVFNLTR
jgi:hypothetical protein